MSKSKYAPKNLPMEEIIEKYVDQMYFITDLCKEYDVTYTTMKNRLVKAGVQIRDKKEEKKRAMNRPETKKKVSEGSKRSAPQRKQTNLERYGHETAMDAPEIRDRWQEEHERKHGVKWGTQRQDTIEKRKQFLLDKYGVDNVSKIPEIAEKISQNRWKNKSEEELIEIIEKMQDLSPESKKRHSDGIKKNRWENKSQEELDDIWDKTVNTWMDNYGYDNPNKRPEAREYLRKQKIKLFIEERLDYILDYLNLELLDNKEEWKNANTRYNFRCKSCGIKFNQYYSEIAYGNLECPGCRPDRSKGQRELFDFIKNELVLENTIKNSRQIIPPQELDIYLPDYNLAIEFDGLYWHREESHNYNKNYHLDKTNKCEKNGIKLIHIFEDEWAFKRDIVKEKLKQILNLNQNKEKIHTRKCEIKKINQDESNRFLEKYHLQGIGMPSRIRLGAYHNNNLVAIMTFSKGNPIKGFKKEDGKYELNRFCSNYNYHIPGIASKLLEYFKRNYNWNVIFTYSDKRWSIGDLYIKLGFNYVHDSDPRESYVYGMKRIHKFSLRKLLHENGNEVITSNNKPEWRIRLEQGYYIVWDCGHKLFEVKNE